MGIFRKTEAATPNKTSLTTESAPEINFRRRHRPTIGVTDYLHFKLSLNIDNNCTKRQLLSQKKYGLNEKIPKILGIFIK